MTISGEGSSWTSTGNVHVGKDGAGTLDISDGGDVMSQRAYVGHAKSGTGVTTVSRGGSTWHVAKSVEVGKDGDGTIKVENGGLVDIGKDLRLASKKGSTATLAFSIGDDGTGSAASGLINVGKKPALG